MNLVKGQQRSEAWSSSWKLWPTMRRRAGRGSGAADRGAVRLPGDIDKARATPEGGRTVAPGSPPTIRRRSNADAGQAGLELPARQRKKPSEPCPGTGAHCGGWILGRKTIGVGGQRRACRQVALDWEDFQAC